MYRLSSCNLYCKLKQITVHLNIKINSICISKHDDYVKKKIQFKYCKLAVLPGEKRHFPILLTTIQSYLLEQPQYVNRVYFFKPRSNTQVLIHVDLTYVMGLLRQCPIVQWEVCLCVIDLLSGVGQVGGSGEGGGGMMRSIM